MSNVSDPALPGYEQIAPPLQIRRRRWPWLLVILVFVSAGAGGLYAWPMIAPLVPTLGHGYPEREAVSADKDALPDLLVAQQKADENLAALIQTVVSQQEQLKTITGQLASLSAKLDALQSPVPVPMRPQIDSEPPRTPVARTAKQKKLAPRKPKPAGPISTGGAPFSATLDATPE